MRHCTASQVVLRTLVVCCGLVVCALGSTKPSACRAEEVNFEGWRALRLSNDWVRVTIVPQLGGRLMQVEFGGHPYLFVNPEYKGKYLPPAEASKSAGWVNYGGDKLWPLPEGHGDDQHWPGPVSDALDDGEYESSNISRDGRCTVHLQGPADSFTGLQYARDISISGDSPEISSHSLMKNASTRPIRWSMQTVTQYDTADAGKPGDYNHDFWAFAPLSPHSAYVDGYHVRMGLADDPSFSANNGLFTLHWLYLQNEVWLDSTAGWLVVADASSRYAMVEKFQHVPGAEYPGQASIIFYKNGATLELAAGGTPVLRSADPATTPYYMEAEVNSPMISLQPRASYSMDTNWFPVRSGKELAGVTSAGLIAHPLSVAVTGGEAQLSGQFAVFYPGRLYAHIRCGSGEECGTVALQEVDPLTEVELKEKLKIPSNATQISVRLSDANGVDRGSLGDASIRP